MTIDRRAFLRGAGLSAAAAVAAPTLLAACGSAKKKVSFDVPHVRMVNRPLAIDDDTITKFGTATGVQIDYSEYTSEAVWLAEFGDALRAGRDVGSDIVVLSDATVAGLAAAGALDTLPATRARATLQPALARPPWDRTRRLTLPWSARMVGIAYDSKRVAAPLRTFDDLLSLGIAGSVTLLDDPRATVGLAMLAAGADPSRPTLASAAAAFDRLDRAVRDGLIARFASTEWTDDLKTGRAIAAVARSDAFYELHEDDERFRFVVPSTGGMVECDNMIVPAHARNRGSIAAWFDYVYDPQHAAHVTGFVRTLSPVVDVEAELQTIDPKYSTDPVLVPPAAVWKRLHTFGSVPATESAEFAGRFTNLLDMGRSA